MEVERDRTERPTLLRGALVMIDSFLHGWKLLNLVKLQKRQAQAKEGPAFVSPRGPELERLLPVETRNGSERHEATGTHREPARKFLARRDATDWRDGGKIGPRYGKRLGP